MSQQAESVQTRSQKYLREAAKLVGEARELSGDGPSIYGGLCHQFPVMVRTCGLCQALAFSAAKAASGNGEGNGPSPRANAHRLLLTHVGKLIGNQNALELVQKADALEYMTYTRTVLEAWIYFKRFAVSILKVENAGTLDGEKH